METLKNLKRPSWMTDKKMHNDDPWCELTLENFMERGMTLTTYVLKFYANDCTKAGARFMVRAVSEATGSLGDMGDEYCANVFKSDLVKVMGRDATDDEKREWLHLRTMAKEISW